MATIAKMIRVYGNDDKEILETSKLLQEFLDKTDPADLRKLLLAFRKNPLLLKSALTALKFA